MWLAVKPYIEIPLDNITCIGALFVDGFLTERVADFIILRVADVVNIIVGFIVNEQSVVGIEVVDELTIVLFFQATRYVGVTDKFVNHSLEYDVEGFHKQVFALRCIDAVFVCLIEEGIT